MNKEEFECPEEPYERGQWFEKMNTITTDYCESFKKGEGCWYIDTCPAYRKAKDQK